MLHAARMLLQRIYSSGMQAHDALLQFLNTVHCLRLAQR
jgi:hypothetical protein